MSKTSDAKVVLKGLWLVSRTAVSHKAREAENTWRYSSAKRSFDDVVRGVKDGLKDDKRQTSTQVVKTGSVAFARAWMIPQGIWMFVRFKYLNFRPSSTAASSKLIAQDPQVNDSRRRDVEDRPNSVAYRANSVHVANSVVASPSTLTPRRTSLFGDAETIKTVDEVVIEQKLPAKAPKPKLSEKSKERKVPASRVGRLATFGGLAVGLGFGAVAEATRRTLNPSSAGNSLNPNVFLSNANVERIVNTMCRVRGAALKLGQMLSLQDESMVSPQLIKIFERVRQSADFMPVWQTEKVLEQELGQDWRSKVGSFERLPFAAASIGQVHLAKMPDGREVAIKIQYPGVAASIESDIRNLMGMLKVWNILPPGLFIDNIVAVASRELAREVDYIHELECAKRFRELLKAYPVFNVPEVIDSLSTRQVFTTGLVEGLPLDKCVDMDQETRNQIATELFRLTLMELFDFRFMQTDPNWANFLYDPATRRISLLDFGASREYSKQFLDQYAKVIKAGVDGDRDGILTHSRTIGFLTGYETKLMENAHIESTVIIGEAFRGDHPFDFSVQNITSRIRNYLPIMMYHRLTPPPEEIYSLHRKLSGIFLLGAKLKAKVNCGPIFKEIYDKYTAHSMS